MLVARQYRIAGRVQGVGFRFFAEDAARREGVSGWVRNSGERGVEVFAEGDAEAVQRFETAIRVGPPGALVEELQVVELLPEGRAPGFTIRSSSRDGSDWPRGAG